MAAAPQSLQLVAPVLAASSQYTSAPFAAGLYQAPNSSGAGSNSWPASPAIGSQPITSNSSPALPSSPLQPRSQLESPVDLSGGNLISGVNPSNPANRQRLLNSFARLRQEDHVRSAFSKPGPKLDPPRPSGADFASRPMAPSTGPLNALGAAPMPNQPLKPPLAPPSGGVGFHSPALGPSGVGALGRLSPATASRPLPASPALLSAASPEMYSRVLDSKLEALSPPLTAGQQLSEVDYRRLIDTQMFTMLQQLSLQHAQLNEQLVKQAQQIQIIEQMRRQQQQQQQQQRQQQIQQQMQQQQQQQLQQQLQQHPLQPQQLQQPLTDHVAHDTAQPTGTVDQLAAGQQFAATSMQMTGMEQPTRGARAPDGMFGTSATAGMSPQQPLPSMLAPAAPQFGSPGFSPGPALIEMSKPADSRQQLINLYCSPQMAAQINQQRQQLQLQQQQLQQQQQHYRQLQQSGRDGGGFSDGPPLAPPAAMASPLLTSARSLSPNMFNRSDALDDAHSSDPALSRLHGAQGSPLITPAGLPVNPSPSALAAGLGRPPPGRAIAELSPLLSASPPLRAASPHRLGGYSAESRRERVAKFQAKRRRWRETHVVNRTFEGRKAVAESKPRIKGRFVKREVYDSMVGRSAAAQSPAPSTSSSAISSESGAPADNSLSEQGSADWTFLPSQAEVGLPLQDMDTGTALA